MRHLDSSSKYFLGKDLTKLFEDNSIKESQANIQTYSNLLLENKKGEFMNMLYENEDILASLLDISYLNFSADNSKLGSSVLTFSLPAGWTCPFADKCLKMVDKDRKIDPKKIGTYRVNKKGEKIYYKGDVVVTKGKDAEFDCFAANQELQYDLVRANRWENKDLLEAAGDYKGQSDLIIRSLNYYFDTFGTKDFVRIHESGDFFNGEYMKAWLDVASKMPHVHFYAYTKSLPFVKKHKEVIDSLPNFALTLSVGGKRDRDISSVDIKKVEVYNTPEEILEAGLILDLDDNLAKEKGGNEKDFGLLVHGTQEAGEMSQHKMRNETFANYWKNRAYLNRTFKDVEDKHMSLEEAEKRIVVVQDVIDNLESYSDTNKVKLKKDRFSAIRKQLKYVIKYYKYNFDNNLINIIPNKYR